MLTDEHSFEIERQQYRDVAISLVARMMLRAYSGAGRVA